MIFFDQHVVISFQNGLRSDVGAPMCMPTGRVRGHDC